MVLFHHWLHALDLSTAVGQVLLNVRIGTMENEPSAAVQQFIKAIGVMFFTGHKLMALVRLQQLLRPWIWREHVEAWDIIYDFCKSWFLLHRGLCL